MPHLLAAMDHFYEPLSFIPTAWGKKKKPSRLSLNIFSLLFYLNLNVLWAPLKIKSHDSTKKLNKYANIPDDDRKAGHYNAID